MTSDRSTVIPFPATGTSLVKLHNKLCRAMEHGQGIKLSAAQLDALMLSGALDLLRETAGEILKARARERAAEREAPIFWSGKAPNGG